MYFLAPLVLVAGFSFILYGQKLIMSEEEYDANSKFVHEWMVHKNRYEAFKKHAKGVVQQFLAAPGYGKEMGQIELASKFTVLRS